MNKRDTIFDFLSYVFFLYGVIVMLFIVLNLIIGDYVMEYSSLFSLGKFGISISNLLRFLIISVLITGIREIFFTDKLIKNASKICRTIGMLCSIIIFMSFFIYIFKWFPHNSWLSWVMFLLSFFICFLFSLLLVILKERYEDRKMKEGLENIKTQLKEEKREKLH